jgi:hypothetical protein
VRSRLQIVGNVHGDSIVALLRQAVFCGGAAIPRTIDFGWITDGVDAAGRDDERTIERIREEVRVLTTVFPVLGACV